MEITVNGEQAVVPNPITLAELLQSRRLAEKRVAIEVNGRIVPRAEHPDTALSPGDRIEIVHALGGG